MLLALGGMMLLPVALSAYLDEPVAAPFLLSAFLTVSVGGLFILAGRGREMWLSRREGFVLTASLWISVSLFGALPIALSLPEQGFIHALFESVSGITTTGSTVLTGLDQMPKGLLLWRGLLQWIGGAGFVTTALALLPFLQIGGMQLFRTETIDRAEKVLPGARQIAFAILSVYATLSGLCALAYWIAGMSAFDAIVHAMTTLSTGGYGNYDASFGQFDSDWVRGLATAFMIAGATTMTWFVRLGRGDWRALYRDSQVRTFLLILVVAVAVVAAYLIVTGRMAPGQSLSHAAFNVVSIATTTGYASADYGAWGAFSIGVFFLLTFTGGCTGSTSGAIKIFRFEIVWRLMSLHMRRILNPRAVVPIKYGGRLVGEDVLLSVMAFLLVYVLSVGVFAVALALIGLDLTTSLTGAATAVGNVGPGLGPVIGPVGNFSTLPDAALVVLCLAMLLGRLEFFTLLALLSPAFWRG